MNFVDDRKRPKKCVTNEKKSKSSTRSHEKRNKKAATSKSSLENVNVKKAIKTHSHSLARTRHKPFDTE